MVSGPDPQVAVKGPRGGTRSDVEGGVEDVAVVMRLVHEPGRENLETVSVAAASLDFRTLSSANRSPPGGVWCYLRGHRLAACSGAAVLCHRPHAELVDRVSSDAFP